MLCSIDEGNNTHLNMYANDERTDQKLTQVNTIDHDVKSRQVMTTIVNCTDVQLKILRTMAAHRRDVDTVNQYLTKL